MTASSRPGFSAYLRAAFNARPFGMFVPPNWIGLGGFGLLGLANPGFWVLGAGLELGYLAVLATHPRFQRTVVGSRASDEQRNWQTRVDALVATLEEPDQRRYRALEARCREVIAQQELSHGTELMPGLQAQGQSLGRLAWMFLRLMVMRRAIQKVVEGPEAPGTLTSRLESLRARLQEPGISETLRASLQGQIDILAQRIEKRREAQDQLAFLEAELTRIREQVELIREQAALSTDPEVLTQRIDQIASTLGGTADWIREQQRVYGAVEDLIVEPPPMATERN